MRSSLQFMRFTCVLCAIGMLLTGCGNAGSPDVSSPSNAPTAAELHHLDGTVALRDDTTVTVTPTSGAAQSFTLGDAAQANTVRAMQASGERARVFYRKDAAVAIRSQERPADALTATGRVLEVTGSGLRLKTSNGELEFLISSDNKPGFDMEHLAEHKATREAITVYYRTTRDGARQAITYEDA